MHTVQPQSMAAAAPPARVDLTGALPIPFALTPIGSALAKVRYYLGDETDPNTRAWVLGALERAEAAVTDQAADPIPQQRTTSAPATTGETTVVTDDADSLPALYQLDMLADSDGVDPPFPIVELREDVDLNTPGRLRGAAAQYAELSAKLLAIADGRCTLPGLCDGEVHGIECCTARLAEIATAGLVMQVDIERNHPPADDRPHLQVWIAEADSNGDPGINQVNATITTPTAARTMADALEAFAGHLRDFADTLTQVTR